MDGNPLKIIFIIFCRIELKSDDWAFATENELKAIEFEIG